MIPGKAGADPLTREAPANGDQNAMSSSEIWLRDYETAKQLADDTLAMIQERNIKFPHGGQEASRVTAAARKKLGSLGALIDNMRGDVEAASSDSISEQERVRRRDLISALRSRREQMLATLKRDGRSANRVALMEEGRASPPARETMSTAELDNRGLMQLQQDAMSRQDNELEDLERSVNSTKHIALTVNEELDLHRRLLDDLDEDVEVTHSRMRAAQKKLKHVMRRAGNCRSMCLMIALMIILAVIIIVAFKLASLFH